VSMKETISSFLAGVQLMVTLLFTLFIALVLMVPMRLSCDGYVSSVLVVSVVVVVVVE
jgi:hypothetical protein